MNEVGITKQCQSFFKLSYGLGHSASVINSCRKSVFSKGFQDTDYLIYWGKFPQGTHVVDGVVDPLDLLEEAACEGAAVRDCAVGRRDEAALRGGRDGAEAGPQAPREEGAEAAVGAEVAAPLRLGDVHGEELHVEPDEEDCKVKMRQ